MEEYLFYDIEIFKEDALVVFKNIQKETVKIFVNSFDGLLDLIKGKTLIGYNNYWYDDHILTGMIDGQTPKQLKRLNDRIIVDGERNLKVSPAIKSLDCFQQIDVSSPGLKKIEGNFGKSIIESSIDFTIDRKLTEKELEETIFYCSYDVDTTIDVFKFREKSYFEPKQSIVKMLPEKTQKYANKWNTTTISANVLKDRPTNDKWADIRLNKNHLVPNDELFEIVPDSAVDMWLDKNRKRKKYTHKEFGCNIEFSFGGLHGVPIESQKRFENVKLLDVASLYPNIILKLNALGQATTTYKEIVEKRLAVKHTDQELQKALKLVINSCYGLLNNQYSILYNPKAALSVCIFGQICLYDLCTRLAPTCKLVNINTDGVAFTTSDDDYKKVWQEWENDYGFTLEEDSFDLFIQKDVNNYIGVKDGKIKVKGGDVGRYHDDAWFKNNNTRIVDIAVVDKLVYGKDVLTTLQENMENPRLFQLVLQAGHTYKGTCDADRNMYQKINRVFPLKKGGVTLYKLRADDGLVRFPDTPEHMLVWNEEVTELTDFSKKIDINFYYQLINRVLERWE